MTDWRMIVFSITMFIIYSSLRNYRKKIIRKRSGKVEVETPQPQPDFRRLEVSTGFIKEGNL